MKIVIAGGTGFIGKAVVELLLSQEHDIFVLSRSSSPNRSTWPRKAAVVSWDGKTSGKWVSVLEDADAVINFSGENISAREWTSAYKQILRDSRLDPTRAIVNAIAACRKPPRVFVNASAVGYYGDAGDSILDETSLPGKGFLADLCVSWERAALEAKEYGVRVIAARMGVVLGRGGVLNKLIIPFRSYVGGPLGSGRQWMPWISRKDLAAACSFMITHNDMSGPVNCVAPDLLTMNGFCVALGAALRRPSWIRCPSFVLRAALGEMAGVVLSSQRVVPKKLLAAGFKFQQPLVKEALLGIFGESF